MYLAHHNALTLLHRYSRIGQKHSQRPSELHALESGRFYRIPMRHRKKGFGKLRIRAAD